MNSCKNNAFTLIELVVAATILVILTSVGFYSYTQSISDARDGARKTDLATLSSQLSLYKKQRGSYPIPGNSFEIHNRWYTVASQGYLNNEVSLSTADKIPKDPDLEIPYVYSVTSNRQEYQLAASFENSDFPFASVSWDYKSVAINVLPSILLAIQASTSVEINSAVGAGSTNRDLFILDTWNHTLPYNFIDGAPFTDGADFDTILADVWDNYWQNTDFISCGEIYIAKKHITVDDWSTSDEYQIRSSTGALTNTGCIFTP